MVVLVDEIRESFFETDLVASFRLKILPDLELPTHNSRFLGDLWSNISTVDNKKMFHKLSDELGKTIGKHQVVYRPAIGRYTRAVEPQARESLLKPSFPSGEAAILSPSKASSSTLTVDTIADSALEDGLSAPALSSAGFTSLPHVKALSAAFLERTPFAIDDVGDDEDDNDLDLVHGKDDNRVMDEVDVFLEADDSELSEADKEVVKDLLNVKPM
ncbi:hypothetical protein SCLCIDRAFT_408915 [Scleroderma citrinum Foug A]|uniref:Uncharacterized protein n=1 Tax=Scleroderma citrinum Foug A TaxID=1036808 RepID=A0A0C3CZ63_9AGAM|nr:hypothetical protein SCLCIDRAFT_408915 [Scleroderma citrinum Foug A]